MMTPLEWHKFCNGHYNDPITICRVGRALVNHLGADDDRLLLSPKTASKIIFKHNVRSDEFQILPLAAEFGTVMYDRPNSLSIYFDADHIYGGLYHVAVKTTAAKHELWVSTFFRIRNEEYERRRKKSKIIRIQM